MAATVMTTLPQLSGLRPSVSAAPVKRLVSSELHYLLYCSFTSALPVCTGQLGMENSGISYWAPHISVEITSGPTKNTLGEGDNLFAILLLATAD